MALKILMVGMTKEQGGIETYILNLIRHMDISEYKFYFPHVQNMAYEKELVDRGCELIYNLPRSRRKYVQYHRAWNQMFKQYHFDAIYFNNCDIVSLGVLQMAKQHNVAIRIFHAHNSANTQRRNVIHKISEWYNRHIVNRIATHLLACSQNAGDFIFGKHPYREIKNGIEVVDYAFSERTRDKKRDEFGIQEEKVFLYVGRFTKIKNPLFAVNVIAKMRESGCNVRAYFCGDGALKPEVQRTVEQKEYEEFISLLGNRNDVRELYQMADYLIMPSLFEGFPFVLVEAQCAGLKCICSSNVEENTNLTGTVEYLPLAWEEEKWAEVLLDIETNQQREQYVHIIQQHGFDIRETVQTIENILSES